MVYGGGEGVKPKQDDSDWKFQTCRGTNLAYDMLYEPKSSDNKEKEGDNSSGNRLINLKIDNQHTYFLCADNVHRRRLYI